MRDEVRLGLVLYGGVSLAIYINGVAQEFWNIVKGRGPYRLLKGLIEADVVVDIVSGTSAGGINGVLLSYALANDRDFKHCSKLWREHADFQRMLRPVDAKDPSSVLDGEEYFRDRLVDIYRTMPPWAPAPWEPRPRSQERNWESKLDALDLFVTGTDYDGEVSTRVDALGHAIDIKDHRKVFKLKYRLGRANDFETTWDTKARPPRTEVGSEPRVRALATISRCTSSFPGAFPPTVVRQAPQSPDQGPRPSPPPPADPDAQADALVRTWGGFTKRTDFLDGGVLDNKPFTYTIRDIYLHTAERRVVRKLFYVEPDPEHLVPVARTVSPDILSVVLSSLVGIPGYESIAQDLRELDDRNARLQRYREITSILRDKRVISVRTRLGTGTDGEAFDSRPSDMQRDIHTKSRASQMRDRFVDGIRTSPTWADPEGTATIAALAGHLIKQFDALKPAVRERLLDRYDIDYAMRRLFYVSYELYDRLYEGKSTVDPPPRLVNLLAALNREIQVLKVVQYAVERLRTALSRLPKKIDSATDLWIRVHGMLEVLLAWPVQVPTNTGPGAWSSGQTLPAADDAEGWAKWLPDSDIQQLRDRLEARLVGIADSLEQGTSPATVEATTTVVQALKNDAERILDHFLGDSLDDREIRAAWDAFADADAYLFPLEYLSDLQEKDHIEVVRVSPIDARLGFSRTRQGPEKIAGDTLYHFGGFFKRSWRSNDILWGRLDALDLLFECLLTPARVGAAVATTAHCDRLKRYLTGSDNPADFEAGAVVGQIFPHSPSSVKDRITTWLNDLLSQSGDSTSNLRAETALKKLGPDGEMLEILVRAGQLEILEEDLPDVIQDAVDETLEWGTTKRLTKRGEGFERLDVDALVGDVIKEMASQVIRPRAPEAPAPTSGGSLGARLTTFMGTTLGFAAPTRRRLIDDPGDFFDHRYHVGGEDIRRDIPPLILVQTFAHALIVAKNALFAALGNRHVPHGALARRLVRWALEYPLWLAYALASLVRRQPGLGALHFAVLLSAAVVFGAGFYWREAIWWTVDGGGRHLHKPRVVLFAVAPLLVLAVQFTWLRWTLLARSSVDWVFVVLRMIGLAAAAAVLVWGIHGGEYEGLAGPARALVDGARQVLTSRTFYIFVALPLGLFLLCWRFRLPSRWSRRP
jgi:patatin-related protein